MTIQPLSLHLYIRQSNCANSCNEELRTVGIRTSISHREKTRTCVLQLEVFIVELFTVDAFTTSTITISEITTLNHEIRNNTMENGTLVVKRLSRFTNALFTSTKSTEVFHSLRNCLAKSTYQNPKQTQTSPSQYDQPSLHLFQYQRKPY